VVVPAYVIVELSVVDTDRYEQYKERAEASVAAHGGTYKVRGGSIESVEGAQVTDRVVILEFPDMQAARSWYRSPEYQSALQIRLAAARTTRMYFIDGFQTS
jgi:uncharacterized protein (DUF1330 family)